MAFAASPPFAVAQGAAREVVIEIGGDVLPESSWQEPADLTHLFDGVKDEFAGADLVFVNLEEPITLSSLVTPYKHSAAVSAGFDYILKSGDRRIPEIFKASGIGLVGLANNHMMDYRRAGLQDTLAAFRSAGLPTVGAGVEVEAERPYIFEKNGIRVALLAFSDVVPTHTASMPERRGIASSQPAARLLHAIREARKVADFVVLMIHWGGQNDHRIILRQRELARAAVRAGCDAIVGMHPHVLQGIEFIGGVPVFYSVGNLAFPSEIPEGRECVLVKLRFNSKHLAAVDLVPVEISALGVPAVATGDEMTEIDSHLDQFCRVFNTRIREGSLIESSVRETLVYAPDKYANRRGPL